MIDKAALIIRPTAEVGECGPICLGGKGECGVEAAVCVGYGGGGEEPGVRVVQVAGGIHEVGVAAGNPFVSVLL